ncbi:hypothetical protein BVRB_5g108380 isoform B [Beta vulgaris subsp. vulgaris]|nr:hypothetical protein BVRB_5g108380 isoform B [Beta vulgaris subsp. vulgaris]
MEVEGEQIGILANINENETEPESPILPKRRSPYWDEFLAIDPSVSKDGKFHAICKHCKLASFIATSHYGTSNMKKHLDKCSNYAAHLVSVKNDGHQPVFDQKVYRELVSKTIIKQGWNSTYMMLDRAILYRAAFEQMQKVDSCGSYCTCPELEEWENLEQIRNILEPFSHITELFFGSNYPTSNLYFENVWKIAMLLKDLV